MKLIIVESPTKARTLAKFLGSDYQIQATMGHLRDLPVKTLGVEIEGGKFLPRYELVVKKKEIIDKLKHEAESAGQIILATDPDREGEAIAWHVGEILTIDDRRSKIGVEGRKSKIEKNNLSSNLNYQPPSSIIHHRLSFQRIVFHEITESAIKEALQNPRSIDMNLVDSQQARRILDRLVGYKLSPLLWIKIRRGLSAGRVQSVAVRLIVEREREIKAFKAEEYWEIQAELESAKQKTFLALLAQKNDKKIEIKNKEEADKLLTELKDLQYEVKSVETKDIRKFPYPPFTTSTMQQAGSNLFGWTAKKTMQIAQKLYEQGLITYHRTDSLNLADQAVSICRDFIKKEYGTAYLPETPKFYKTKSKVAQEAHEAIRPTDVRKYSSNEVRSSQTSSSNNSSRDEKRLYDLIWKRFVACQMREAVYEETRADIEAKEAKILHNKDTAVSQLCKIFLFRANGSKLKFDGWKKLYSVNNLTMKQFNNETMENEGEKALPSLIAGELLNLLKLIPCQHFTEPPARFNEASLIKTLEDLGIGRPSTYAPIITTIQLRQYVEKVEKRFQPTVLGETVSDFLVKNFSEIVDYDFTAKMEDSLDGIAAGKINWQPVLSEFYRPFEQKLATVRKEAVRVKVPVEETDEICEKCGGKMVIRLGRFGKFLACANFPKCKNTKTIINKTGLICPKCGGEIIMKRTKSKRNFYGCSNYPKCDFASWKKEEILKPASPASKGDALQS